MIIDGNRIIAEAGKVLRRKEDKQIVGREYSLGYLYYMNGERLPEPKLEVATDFEELDKSAIEELKKQEYAALVEKYIREKYTVSDELGLQRQRDTKPDNFREYFDFCEGCKSKARAEIEEKYPFIIDPVEPETES